MIETEFVSRIEKLLLCLCENNTENLPIAESRIELWITGIINKQLPNIQAESRIELFLKSIIINDVNDLPIPESRVEILLDKLARQSNDLDDCEEPQSRIEILLYNMIEVTKDFYLVDEKGNTIVDEFNNLIGKGVIE